MRLLLPTKVLNAQQSLFSVEEKSYRPGAASSVTQPSDNILPLGDITIIMKVRHWVISVNAFHYWNISYLFSHVMSSTFIS